MKSKNYERFYDQIGKLNGWDFSDVKCVSEGVKRDFWKEAAKVCKPSDLLLDIGTGGGEALLTMTDSALLLVGIDLSAGMIETATRNAAKAGVSNVRFLQMDAMKLDFPGKFFNVVTCRHSAFCTREIARVLLSGGIFLTQQVSENDKLNLKEAFGRGQALGAEPGTLKKRYETELNEAGFVDIQSFEYNATEYYETAEDLMFLLQHTPIIPGFGQNELDYQVFYKFIRDHQTEKGIRTNAARFMITARFPG